MSFIKKTLNYKMSKLMDIQLLAIDYYCIQSKIHILRLKQTSSMLVNYLCD